MSKLHFLTCPAQAHHAVVFSASSNRCHESIYPISFLNFSNLSYVLSQTCPKMCPRPDMSRSRPGHVPDMYSKCPCPDHLGTSPKISWVNLSYVLFLFLKLVPRPCPTCLKMRPRPDMSQTHPGRVPDMSWTCPQNVPVLTILGHLQIGRVQLSSIMNNSPTSSKPLSPPSYMNIYLVSFLNHDPTHALTSFTTLTPTSLPTLNPTSFPNLAPKPPMTLFKCLLQNVLSL